MLFKSGYYQTMTQKIRPAGCAGKYYSNQKSILEREVAVFLENATPLKHINTVYGLIAPNDNFFSSGGVAARSYRQIIDRDIDNVIIISSSRHTYYEEISVFNGEAYNTPMGRVNIASELATEIADGHENIILSDMGHETEENGIEVQLPFLQQIFYDFTVVPIMMGNQDTENIRLLSDAITRAVSGKKALIVASTNLSENHPYEQAVRVDKNAVAFIEKFDAEGLNEQYQAGAIEMSSGGAAICAMQVCKKIGAQKSNVLLYRNSGDMGTDKNTVTGYLAAVFYD